VALKEVSCRFFDAPLRDLKERGVDPSILVEGTVYTPKQLASKDERVEWTTLLRILQNGRAVWTREQLLALGKKSTEGPLVQFIGVVAKIRFSVAGFYQWVTAPDGVASQMITCVKIRSKPDGPGQLTVDFRMEPGYEPSEEFFLITQGTYAAMPRMMGASPAKVEMEMRPDGARMWIRFTEPRGVLPAMRRFVTAPFTMKQAAKELTDAHGSLLARYEELDTARAEIQRNHELLDVAYQLGQGIATLRDLGAVARSVMTTLLARAGVLGARVTIDGAERLCVEDGTRESPHTLSVDLAGTPTARIELWTAEADADARRLLDMLVPTIRLALDNAVAYRELADYQAGLEKLVDQRTLELREAQEAREKFFANISHEIRTPLSLILLSVADIERRAGALMDERSRGGLGSISEATRKLVRLVDELLLLAAGQADKLVLAPEPTDLNNLVDQLVAAWRPAAEAAGLSLQSKAPAARTFASVDPVAFERVASNLVSNAVKYTPRGGTVSIELAVDDTLRLSVLDTGPGIDRDLAERLFGRFERAAGSDRRKAGTGIGLALVKQLVEAHGGIVAAIQRPTGGSEFRVTLPLSRIVEARPALGGSSMPLRTTYAPLQVEGGISSGTVLRPPGLSAGTILIAEDEPRLAEAIASLLAEQYMVIVALDGVSALELVQQHQPQLLITDVDMPGMNGIELAKRFRETTGDRLAPIVILSAVIDLNTRLAGLEAGAVDYIGKPFDPAELRARVASQFRMRELAMRLHRAEQLSSMAILTSGLAHELRNPANGIVNAIAPLQMLLPEDIAGAGTDVGELLDAMKSCADQIAFLVRQLLGFRTNTDLDLRPCDLSPLVQRAVGLAKEALQEVDVRIDMNVGRRVLCAQPLLVQVVANLIENAGHAAKRGGWVAIRGRSVGNRITLEITDSGPGVPQELRERVFEPFFTTKSPGKGTGLGLSVARAIVHRHNGTLEISDRENRSAFLMDLPAESTISQPANAL
jgi:signal transduction histidine kinase